MQATPTDIIAKHIAHHLINDGDTKSLISLAKAHPRILRSLHDFDHIQSITPDNMEYGYIWFYIDLDDPLFIERTIRMLKRTFQIDSSKNRLYKHFSFDIIMVQIVNRDILSFWKGLNNLKNSQFLVRKEGKIGKSGVTLILKTKPSSAVLSLEFPTNPIATYNNKHQLPSSDMADEFVTFSFFDNVL